MIEGISGTPGGGLPLVDQALEPQWVRNGSPATQKAYALAESFEAILVQQLSQSMANTSGLDGEEGSGGGEGDAPGTSPQPSQLSTLLPQALSDGTMRAGGLGMAAQLTHELQASPTGIGTAVVGPTSVGPTSVGTTGVGPTSVGPAGGVGANGASAPRSSGLTGGVSPSGSVAA